MAGFEEAFGLGHFKSQQSEKAHDDMIEWAKGNEWSNHTQNSHFLKLPEYLSLNTSRINMTEEVSINLKLPTGKGGNNVSITASFLLSDPVEKVFLFAAKKFRSLGLAFPDATTLPNFPERNNRVLKVVGEDNYLLHADFILAQYDCILETYRQKVLVEMFPPNSFNVFSLFYVAEIYVGVMK